MTHFSKSFLFAAIAALALAGCAGGAKPVGLASTVELVDLTTLPAPDSTAPRTIGMQEQLEITVYGSEPLSGTFLTDSEGYISYPLVGDLYVSGKSPGQAAKMIADRLRGEFVIDPQVNVRPTQAQALTVSLGGEVANPGTYPATTSTSLLRAINNAGGLDEYAKSDDVLVMRTVNEQRYIGVFNIEAIKRGNYADPEIYPDDVVIVGESAARRRLDTILQFIPLVSTTAILLERVIR
ncbi:polysaccharide biosynthesis/export family protein [Pontixanthobacter aquaemixtae]|nr:polysaccharide biosynthesis/export family protein [Pontixanthobacter aquaemixtae]